MAEPRLFPMLGVRALAVCGALCCRDGVVLGRRDAGSVYQPGLWQLPPAGSVDRGADRGGTADLHAALMAELEEELGLGPDAITAIRPLCLVEHPTGGLDLGMQLMTGLTGAEILGAHRARGNDEYSELAAVPAMQALNWIAARGGAAVPTVTALLRRLL